MPGKGLGVMMTTVIATSRVAQQTSRWARFAKVTVEVVPAAADEVTVAQGVFRDEALCRKLYAALTRRCGTCQVAEAVARTPRTLCCREPRQIREPIAAEADGAIAVHPCARRSGPCPGTGGVNAVPAWRR